MTATSDNEEHAAAHTKLRQLKWDRIENFTVFATKFLELANIAGVTESQKINMFLQSLPPAFTDNIKSTMRYQQTFNSEVQPTLKQIIDLAEQRSDVFRDRYGLWYIYASQKFWILFDYGMRNPQRFMAFSTLVLALLYWQFLMSPTKPNSPIANFAALTNGIFVQINSVDIPASDDITKHALEFKKVANMIDYSPAFASNNKKIAHGLRQFEKKVTRAGTDLKKMYRKGDNVFVTFHTEIEALFDIVDTGKASGLRERTDRMLRVVREFRTHVEKAKNSMLEAENQRDDVEKNIFVGLREAEKYVNEDHWYKSQTDVAIAKRELDVVVDVLKCLQSTGKNLEIILKVLDEYESSLLDVQTELSGMVIYTKADFNYLIRSLKDLHKSHKRFMLKDSKPTIFGWLW